MATSEESTSRSRWTATGRSRDLYWLCCAVLHVLDGGEPCGRAPDGVGTQALEEALSREYDRLADLADRRMAREIWERLAVEHCERWRNDGRTTPGAERLGLVVNRSDDAGETAPPPVVRPTAD